MNDLDRCLEVVGHVNHCIIFAIDLFRKPLEIDRILG